MPEIKKIKLPLPEWSAGFRLCHSVSLVECHLYQNHFLEIDDLQQVLSQLEDGLMMDWRRSDFQLDIIDENGKWGFAFGLTEEAFDFLLKEFNSEILDVKVFE